MAVARGVFIFETFAKSNWLSTYNWVERFHKH